jgi:membrane protein implicated in regulation of membrane protease activity
MKQFHDGATLLRRYRWHVFTVGMLPLPLLAGILLITLASKALPLAQALFLVLVLGMVVLLVLGSRRHSRRYATPQPPRSGEQMEAQVTGETGGERMLTDRVAA